MAGFKRDRCVVAVSWAAMSDVKFCGTRWGNSITPPSPKVPSQKCPKPWTPVRLAAMSDWQHEAALQLRRAAVSLGRGVVAHVRYVIL